MSTVEQAAALLESITPAQLAALPPTTRRRFADRCRYVASLAEPAERPTAGVLFDLHRGARTE